MEPCECTVVVERVLSQLQKGCIFVARRDDGSPIRIKFSGQDKRPLPGDAFVVKGLLSPYRDRFGREVPQLDTKRMQRIAPPGALLGPWLERLPNIGATRAKRLLDAFGHDLMVVLCDASRMAEVAGLIEPGKPALAAKIAAQLYAAVALQAGADKVKVAEVEFLTFLEKVGVREQRVASQLWRFMSGTEAVGRLRRNPYLASSLVEWSIADKLGQRLLRDGAEACDFGEHPERLLGALSSVWREILSNGDTAATEECMKQLLAKRSVNPALALEVSDERGLLKRADGLLRAPGAAWLEDQVAKYLTAMESSQPTVSVPQGKALETLVSDAEYAVGMQLTQEQHAAVVSLLTMPVAALQGGAGVGKTTVMKVLATAWEFLGGQVVMGALAGKAALTLSRGASSLNRPRYAFTVARLIGMLQRQRMQHADPAVKRPESDIIFGNKVLLVIDEAGMLDTPSLRELLDLLPPGARILFAGDEGQLPPVGIGKIFHDLVTDGSRVAQLTKVLRQADDSAIPLVARAIRDGEVPTLTCWKGEPKGVYLVAPSELDAVQRRLRSRVELMVVAARRATVDYINESEANFARQGRPTRRLGPLATIAAGDPVVMTTNRYQDGLFNGLLGIVTAIDGTEVLIHWDGESEPRALPGKAEAEVELAYGITCHKAQGSSSQVLIAVVENSMLVTREWLYTAITRGRELVLLVGDETDIRRAVGCRTVRTTGFALRYSDVGCTTD